MIDQNKLNRIKGVLKAQSGGETPTLPKYTKLYNGLYIYSNDNQNWFSDNSLKKAFTGDITPFQDVTILSAIPGDPNITPTTAVENSQQINDKVEELLENEIIKDKIKIPDTTLADWNDPIAQTMKNTSSTTLNAPTIELSKEMLLKLAEDVKNNSAGMNINPQKIKNTLVAADVFNTVFKEVGNVVGSALAATDSKLTLGIDSAYNGIANTAEKFGPIGKVVGTAMKAAGAAGNIIQAMGGGTDQQTKMDKWMDSAFFSWNIGMLNGFAGKKSDSFSIDNSTAERVGGAYGGSLAEFNELALKANKEYGLFSSAARKRTNKLIEEAKRQQNLMSNIADEAELQRLNALYMGELSGLAYQTLMDGGYNLKYTYAAKHGGVLNQNISEQLEWEIPIELNWELPEFKEGGSIELQEELEWIPELQEGGKTRNIDELIEYAKKQNPRFIQRLSEPPQGIKFIDDEGNEAEGSHYLTSIDNYVIPRILEIDGKLQFLNEDEAYKRALDTGNYLELTPEEANIFAKEYKQGWPEFFQTFKQGGSLGNKDIPETEETTQKNVIPEGALHKNKHHMEHAEGLTKKGIPVVDEDGDLQAEIEHSEIIFTLEVTKKLEEYYDIFYSEDSSEKEKEQAATNAGKLLVYLILENTDDRTGLIESCKKGGQLTHNTITKSGITKNLMKEVMKEALLELLTK